MSATPFVFPGQSPGVPVFADLLDRIVRALDERSWSVDGFEVEFRQSSPDQKRYWYVSDIRSQELLVRFAEPGILVGIAVPNRLLVFGWINTSGAFELNGEAYWRYIGQDWLRDRYMPPARLQEASRVIRYDGACQCEDHTNVHFLQAPSPHGVSHGRSAPMAIPHVHRGRVSPMFIRTSGNEVLSCEEVFAHFTRTLERTLANLEGHPVRPRIDIFRQQPVIPARRNVPMFTLVDGPVAKEIQHGRPLHVERLGQRRIAFRGGTIPADITLPPNVRCFFGAPGVGEHPRKVGVPNEMIRSGSYIVSVNLNRSNDIYVADARRLSWKGESTLAESGVVPLHMYRSEFDRPVVLIGRTLDPSELRIVSGPWAPPPKPGPMRPRPGK